MSIAEEYVKTLRAETKMFAVYPPVVRVQLGDIGRVVSGRFIPEGNLRRLDPPILFDTIASPGVMNAEHKSKKVRRVAIGAGATVEAGVVTAKARLQLDFGDELSIYVAVAGCTHSRINDILGVGAQIVQRSRAGTWNDNLKVVTSIIESSNTTVIIGRQEGSKVVLEAEGDVPYVNIADASLSLRMTFDSSSSQSWVTVKDRSGAKLTPFCSLHEIDRDLFGYRPTFDSFEAAEKQAAGALPEPTFRLYDDSVMDGWQISD
jgi:hypothetical protein